MKQFYLGKSVGSVSAMLNTKAAEGVIGIVGAGGETELDKIGNEFLLYVDGEKPYVQPIHKNKLSIVVSKGSKGLGRSFNITMPEVTESTIGTYTLILAAKGVKFNERNKWSIDIYVDKPITGANLALKFKDAIEKIMATGSIPLNIAVTTSDAKLNLVGSDTRDFTIICADNLMGVTVAEGSQKYTVPVNTAEQIEDLYHKCAADKGINYTYRDTSVDLYANYPKLQTSQFSSECYDLVTIRFAEPRVVKTTDEVVNQVVHIAFPNATPSKADELKTLIENVVNGTSAEAAEALEE